MYKKNYAQSCGIYYEYTSLAQHSKFNYCSLAHPLKYSCLENPMDGGTW